MRVALYYAERGYRKRTLDNVSFMVMAVIASCFIHKVDVIVATSPQFLRLALVMWFLF